MTDTLKPTYAIVADNEHSRRFFAQNSNTLTTWMKHCTWFDSFDAAASELKLRLDYRFLNPEDAPKVACYAELPTGEIIPL